MCYSGKHDVFIQFIILTGVTPYSHSIHSGSIYGPSSCRFGIGQSCSARNHFHASPESVVFMKEEGREGGDSGDWPFDGGNFCGQSHNCKRKCESDGVCKVSIDLVPEDDEFVGARGSFKVSRKGETYD